MKRLRTRFPDPEALRRAADRVSQQVPSGGLEGPHDDVADAGALVREAGRVLAAPRPAGAAWRVVAFHQAAFSCSRHQSTPVVQREWVPLFARSGVDLVLNGHDHAYQRFDPISGVTYVVTGAGGSQLYEMGTCPAGTPTPTVAEVRSDYVVLESTGSSLRLQGITADGRVFDSWTIRR